MKIARLDNLSEDNADTFSLVLSSKGILHHLEKVEHRWKIRVDDIDYEKALNTIEQYLHENRNFSKTIVPLYSKYQRTYTGIWVALLLLACHVAITMSDQHEFFVNTYGSSAFYVLHGEFYRSVTSLFIHADALHLIGNMVGIAIFGTAVCTTMGWGVGWLIILASGTVGNLANALLYKSNHISIGASTAIFGAIGILSAYQFYKNFKQSEQKIKAFLPLGGGLALLGMFGSGAHADLMAHLFGFLAGIFLGALYSVFVKHPASNKYQIYSFLITLWILTMAGLKAF